MSYAWIQWKGTDVCMDVHCDCGCMSHVDGDFTYYVKCPRCGKVYECDGHIQLKDTTDEQMKDVSPRVIATPEDDH